MKDSYSVENISPALMEELSDAIKSVRDYGSVEVYVQNGTVTQISTRKIKKTTLDNRER